MINSNKTNLIAGVIIAIAVIVSLFFWFRSTVANSSEISASTKNVNPVNQNILNDANTSKILQTPIYGSVPVQVTPGDVGRANPFANY